MEQNREKTLFEKQKKIIKKDKKLFKITKVQRGTPATKLPLFCDQFYNIQQESNEPMDFDSPIRRGSDNFYQPLELLLENEGMRSRLLTNDWEQCQRQD